jgi:subtilase family serine protease
MKTLVNSAVKAITAMIAVGVISTSANAAKGDWNYIASPPNIKGPAVTTVPTPDWPGFGNHCELLFGTPYTLSCYDPAQIRNAYNVPSGLTGAGQTIIIVDAYGDPTIRDDLASFDALFDLPDPPSLTIITGSATQKAGPHDASNWALETALDVEWAHAIAPGAAIVLAEAPSSSGNAINTLERKVVSRYPGAIVSQSFGIPEIAIIANNAQIRQAHRNYQAFAQQGTTVLASSGDLGATNGYSINNASFPSSDPYVLSVGGTQGDPYPYGLCPSFPSDTCSYVGETT